MITFDYLDMYLHMPKEVLLETLDKEAVKFIEKDNVIVVKDNKVLKRNKYKEVKIKTNGKMVEEIKVRKEK